MAGYGAKWQTKMQAHFARPEVQAAIAQARECGNRANPADAVDCAATIMHGIKKGRQLGFI